MHPRLLRQKQLVGGVIRFIPMCVAKFFQELLELLHLRRRHLHADEYAPVIGTVVAVVEQADVPAGTHLAEEIHQGAGALGKLETIEDFVIDLRRVTADQVANVRLGHLIFGQIERGVAILAQLLDKLE